MVSDNPGLRKRRERFYFYSLTPSEPITSVHVLYGPARLLDHPIRQYSPIDDPPLPCATDSDGWEESGEMSRRVTTSVSLFRALFRASPMSYRKCRTPTHHSPTHTFCSLPPGIG